VAVSRSAARIPEKRRLRRRRATRLRGSICYNRRRRYESTGASGRRRPRLRLRPSPVPWLRAAAGPRPPDPPPRAIGRPIELFVHPATPPPVALCAQDDTTSPRRVHLSHARTLAVLYCFVVVVVVIIIILFMLFCCSFASTPLVRRRRRLLFTNIIGTCVGSIIYI